MKHVREASGTEEMVIRRTMRKLKSRYVTSPILFPSTVFVVFLVIYAGITIFVVMNINAVIYYIIMHLP
jgi:hypothetical protein